ncbi:tRNA guanosine(34) transglycosylase Tgt [Candidatus Woesearchaeota archaeon]|nr:tRNA guanosine(34) transglycosylase Tgt [Candidatus Woesearchaeota archaeon]
MFKIKTADSKTGARAGELKTAHGTVKTPFFMPVATKLTIKHVTPMELEQMGGEALITNAYVTYLKPGMELIKEAGGVHKLMNFNRCVFSDSGGFQMLSESFLKEISDKGVSFNDPFANRAHFLKPENVIQIERELGSDVAMCLDHVPAVDADLATASEAVRRTHVWAERCKRYHDDHDSKNLYDKRQLLFGIAQGALHRELREKSAKFIDSLGFDGNAVGGLCIGETREAMFQALEWQIPHLSAEKPRYMMGVGSPEDIIEAVSKGVDCFDSIYPTQNARHCHVFTRNGTIKLDRGKYSKDFTPLDPECDCYVCRNFSRAYLHHLSRSFEWTHHRYLSYHNVYWVIKFMERIRGALEKGEFDGFKKDFLANYKKMKE